jgi:uncharacterized radical SAM protein YgiQ
MFLPINHEEMVRRGWDECDIIFVTPDAYVDHPSFAMAVLTRFLEKHGYRVGILTQPRWRDPEEFMQLGRPRLAFVVSGGNMDSMVLNYTAAKKPRKEDLFAENGNPFFSSPGDKRKYRIRPDRVVSVYCNQIRSVCSDIPIVIGGIEASLRRIAHYDYWSDSIRRSALFDAKAQLLVYGMGEYPLLEVIREIERGKPFEVMEIKSTTTIREDLDGLMDPVILPSFFEVQQEKKAFAEAFCLFYHNCDGKILAQQQDSRYAIQFPRRELSQSELDAIFDLPFERKPHPRFSNIPAYTMIRESITSHRGCFGNCSFCAITAHQGASVVSRSEESILREVRALIKMDYFKGTITDVGGPSANMYASECRMGGCDFPDCLGKGNACDNLMPGLSKYLSLLQKISEEKGVKHVLVNSGLRFDPVLVSEDFLRGMIRHYISGQLKLGLESGSDAVLALMNKPNTGTFRDFKTLFERITRDEGIRKYINPYIIIGHPGEGEKELVETLCFLEKHHLKGKQFQIFTPTPLTRSTAMYYLGYDPCTGAPVTVEKQTLAIEKRKQRLIRDQSDQKRGRSGKRSIL